MAGCSVLPGYGEDDVGRVGDGALIRVAPADRGRPIELAGETLEGKPLDLASYRGRPVVLNLWGSWCGPCTAEAPVLVAAAKQLEGTAAFLGMTVRDVDTADPIAFQRDHDVPYPSLFDPEGKGLLSFRAARAPTQVPTTIVLDDQGRYAAAFPGALTSEVTLVDLVDDVAAGK